MSENKADGTGREEFDCETGAVSRREFLKLAGIAGATVGMGAGLGGLIAACGGEEETTTTAGGETTTTAGGETTTTAGGETTTTAAEAEMGREVNVGWVTMTTGVFAGLSEPDDFLLAQTKEAIGDGVVCADGMKHPINWIVKDSQSDPNRAAEVTGELITQDNPDLIFGGMTPVVNIPVGNQCEANGVPCVTYGCPMEPWYAGMGGNPGDPTMSFNWAYNVFFSVADLNQVYLGLLDLIPTNKKVACMWPNDPDGEATADPNLGMPPVLEGGGYTVVFPGLFTQGTEDYSSVINQFKAEGCECLVGTWTPPDFANFWKQCIQNGFSPKQTAIARAILTRPDMDAVGDIANGLCLEVWWEKTWPYTSSLTGLTCQGEVDAWDAVETAPYTPALGLTGGGGFEVVVDVVKRTTDVDDPTAFVEAIAATNLDTILGHIQFNAFPNCALSPLVGGQWIGSVGTWERYVVDNSLYPDIPITAEVVDRTTL